MRSGSHGRAVGFGLPPVQRRVPDVRPGPLGLPLELWEPQSAVEPLAGGGHSAAAAAALGVVAR